MDYQLSRNFRNNWEARSDIPLPSDRVLEVVTTKRSNGRLMTTATVTRRAGGFREHVVFQDFCKTIAVGDASRITEKAVRLLHEGALQNIQPVLDAIDLHYDKDAA